MDITNFTEKPNQYNSSQKQGNKQPQEMKIILTDEETQMPLEQASQLTVTSNRGRVAIFIDGSNLFHTALQLGIEIDYTKLLCYLTREARLLRAFFYTGIDRHNEKQQGFLLWMRRNGYRVVTKEIVQLPDGSRKSNQHVEIAVDMMNLSPYYDTAVLVSGDGELTYAINAVAYKGARVEIVSLRSMTNESLIDVADYFMDLDAIKHYIKKNSESCCEEM
ncbi:MAG: NYN domain-containing protein [Cyanobacteria bacterium P01_D01_bin.50]